MGCSQSKSLTALKPSSLGKEELQAAAEKNGRFTYQTDTCALEYWEPIKELGEGSISSIHLVRRRPQRIDVPYREKGDIMSHAPSDTASSSNSSLKEEREEEAYALKSIIKEYVRNDTFLKEMRNEIFTMSNLDHPNIAKVYEAYERKRHIYLIMEYCAGNNLCDREVSEAQAAVIVRKMLSAVANMHEHNVVHRDIKLENIMMDKPGPDGEVKIIDFGLATRYLSDEHKRMTDRVGTLYSMAPQVLQGVYDAKCDLWSIGVVAYILLSGKQPFWGPPREIPWEQRKKIMVDRIMRCDYMRMNAGRWSGVSKEAKDFVKSLLQMDPNKRPSASEAMEHLWIKLHAEDKISLGPPEQPLNPKPTPTEEATIEEMDDDDAEDVILATPANTVIPGGCTSLTERTQFVFDETTNSIRRSSYGD
jgi:serine/threonine protein kinase